MDESFVKLGGDNRGNRLWTIVEIGCWQLQEYDR